MNCKCIAYFTEDRIPLSLRKLNYNRFYNMTDIFIAAAESGDYEELFERLKKVLLDDISVKETTERYICFSVNGNNLKFKKETACLKREVDIMTTRKQIMVGDDVSGLKIYEIINRYFGKQYSGWMKAWYDINDEYAAWFPTITETNEKPSGTWGGTRNCSNTLSSDKATILEIDHDKPEDTSSDKDDKYYKRRLVFGRVNGKFHFLGVFKRQPVKGSAHQTYRHVRIAMGIDLEDYTLIEFKENN